MNAKEIMNKDVFTVFKDTSIKEVLNILLTNKISGLPVIDDERNIIGIITEDDLINENRMPVSPFIVYSDDSQKNREMINEIREGLKVLNVADLMIEDVICVSEDTHVKDIARILVEKGIKRVPVLNKENKLIGIITRLDILKSVENLFKND